MFSIEREDTKIQIKLAYVIPYGNTSWTSTFESGYGSKHHAEAAYSHIRNAFEAAVKAARQEAYEQGYRDKTKRRPRNHYFSGAI